MTSFYIVWSHYKTNERFALSSPATNGLASAVASARPSLAKEAQFESEIELFKEKQHRSLKIDYKKKYDLD